MENSKKAVEEVVLGDEQLEAVVGGASRFVVSGQYKVPSAFGNVNVARLDRSSLLIDVVAN